MYCLPVLACLGLRASQCRAQRTAGKTKPLILRKPVFLHVSQPALGHIRGRPIIAGKLITDVMGCHELRYFSRKSFAENETR